MIIQQQGSLNSYIVAQPQYIESFIGGGVAAIAIEVVPDYDSYLRRYLDDPLSIVRDTSIAPAYSVSPTTEYLSYLRRHLNDN